MRAVQLTTRGSFKRSENFLKRMLKLDIRDILNNYGQKGVEALQQATPKRTGLTANSWSYQVHVYRDGASLEFLNSNFNEGVPIALILQYGHATGWGGYVQGIDYINPALRTVFDDIQTQVWKEVQNA